MKKLGMHFSFLLVAAMLGGLSPSLAAEGLENHARIAETARAYIASRHPWQQMKTKITVQSLDHQTCTLPSQARSIFICWCKN
jgi:hypothetical protein